MVSSPMSVNLDPVAPKAENDDFVLEIDAEADEDHCTICLQAIVDRALIPGCSHEFCFECLMIWSGENPLSSLHTHSSVTLNQLFFIITRSCYRTI